MSKEERNTKLIIGIVLFIITVGLVFYVNVLYSFCGEDVKFYTLLYSDVKIKNLLDIFNAQKWHYMNCGGCVISNALLQLTLIAGDLFANIVNTFMTVITAIILVAIAELMTRQKECFANGLLYVNGTMGLILGLNADWKYTMLQQTGAAGYLWAMVFVLLFIWVYMREIPYDCFGSKEPLWAVNIWIVPLALTAGWSIGNIGIAVFAFTIITIFYVRKVDHIVQPWMILGSVFSFVGAGACVFAPGNLKQYDMTFFNSKVIFRELCLRCFNEFKGIFEFLFIPLLITVVLIALVKGICNQKPGREVKYLCGLALISWLAMILAPNYTGKASYGTMIFLILAQLAMMKNILEKKPALKLYTWVVALIMWGNGIYRMIQYVSTSLGWL